MIESILLGLNGVFQVQNILFCLLGLSIGIIFGALPGFSATMGVAVFVPFSYALPAEAALLMLSGIYCGAVYGGSIPAVLLGIPGTPASVPTSFDGRALTMRGEAGRSLAMVTYASAFGGFLSSLALLIFAPLLAIVAMKVGPPEQMMIAIFGLSVVCVLSEGNMLKGLLVGFLSLLLATIGQDPVMGFPRFTFGNYRLSGGLDVVALLIGLFSIPEVLKMSEQDFRWAKKYDRIKVGRMHLRIKEIKANIFNSIRSTAIGIGVGIIPAAGPDIASFLAYNEARKASTEPEKFGKGSVAGIVASECANNGVTGGSLIPLLTLGIPGSAPAAIFLGAMIIHGLRPGPLLFSQNASQVYTLLVGFGVINIMLFFIGFLFCRFAGRILLVPKAVLASVIVILAVVGSFSINQNMFDVLVMFIAGIIGYIMKKMDYPLSPVALALLLGPMLEEAIMLTDTMYQNQWLMIFTRPLTNIFAVFILISLFWPMLKSKWIHKK